ncbi:MAG: hypothetical protein ACE5G8_02620, partial [Anaerolineae bacterium]
DAGFRANTRQAVQAVALPNTPVVSGRYNGVLGHGAAVSAILHGALQVKARTIIILDGSTRSITPEWIPALATLVLNRQADLVKPRYDHPLPDGGVNDLLYFPFTRAMWGVSLRHPTATDYAISAKLARAVLAHDVWQTEVNRFGFDIWLATVAITDGWRLAQAALGSKQTVRQPSGTRGLTIFKESIGTMLRQVYVRQKCRPAAGQIRSTPVFTRFAPQGNLSLTPPNDCTGYIESLALGWMEYRSLWKRVMLPETLAVVEHLASLPVEQFYFPPNLWAKIAYDFAVVYNKGERDPDTIAIALYPLYLGRLASFWSEVAGLTAVGRAGTVAAQAAEFEALLPYFEYRWKTYLPWVDSGEKR